MLYVYTLFDERQRPLMSGVYDRADPQPLRFYTFWLPHTKKSIYDVKKDIELLSQRINISKSVMLNDFKQHLIAFKCSDAATIYDVPMPILPSGDLKLCRRAIAKAIGKMVATKPQYWHIVRANASRVYAYLQQRGVIFGYELKHPIWSIDVFSGRSKASGFAIQSINQEHLFNINGDRVFINFDWVAADLRAISLICGDEALNKSFINSDPYQYLIDQVNADVLDDKLTRDEGKISLLSSIYALEYDNPTIGIYPGIGKWIKASRNKLRTNRYLVSLLGRKFYINEAAGRTEKTIVNAVVQGTVAHAMQLCLKKVWDVFPDNILTENHDSLVITCTKQSCGHIMRVVAKIMMQPFVGILKANPLFPIKVSVGYGYKKWIEYKRFYCVDDI